MGAGLKPAPTAGLMIPIGEVQHSAPWGSRKVEGHYKKHSDAYSVESVALLRPREFQPRRLQFPFSSACAVSAGAVCE